MGYKLSCCGSIWSGFCLIYSRTLCSVFRQRRNDGGQHHKSVIIYLLLWFRFHLLFFFHFQVRPQRNFYLFQHKWRGLIYFAKPKKKFWEIVPTFLSFHGQTLPKQTYFVMAKLCKNKFTLFRKKKETKELPRLSNFIMEFPLKAKTWHNYPYSPLKAS